MRISSLIPSLCVHEFPWRTSTWFWFTSKCPGSSGLLHMGRLCWRSITFEPCSQRLMESLTCWERRRHASSKNATFYSSATLWHQKWWHYWGNLALFLIAGTLKPGRMCVLRPSGTLPRAFLLAHLCSCSISLLPSEQLTVILQLFSWAADWD